MVQSTLSAKPYRNEGLFNARYLDGDLQSLDDWDCDAEARRALDCIARQFESEYEYVSGLGDNEEDETKDKWIKPVFEVLGFDSKTETNLDGQRGEVDYSLFPGESARQDAEYEYDGAVTVLEAKTWNADFDEKYSERRNYYSADYQIRYYLDYTPEHIQWGILTNGRKWRLYAKRELGAEIFYEIDLSELVRAWISDEEDEAEEAEALSAFKYFYCFFRPEAFTATTDDSFLDRVYRGSDEARRALGEDLQDHVFDALTLVGQGFIDTNDLRVEGETVHLPGPVGEAGAETITLGELKQQSMVYLYRLMFLLNAESQELIQPGAEPASMTYRRELSVYQLCEDVYEVAADPAAVGEQSLSESNTYWTQLRDLFRIIESGSEDLPITAYDGGLFDRAEHPFLESCQLSNRYVAEVLYLLSTTETDEGYELVDYNQQGLGARHLGNIYEGLLEHRFAVADEERVAVTEDDSEVWRPVSEVSAPDPDAPRVAEGELYVVNDDAERKATGSYYTPDYVVEYIVEETVDPLIDEVKSELAEEGYEEGTAEYLAAFKSRVLDLKLVDPAMGSGHFLTEATAQLTERVESVAKESESAVDADVDAAPDDREYAPQQLKRDVAKECIYGVDKNAMAVELAKVSMWLETLSADQPLAFLDHHLKVGNSLVGSDVEEINGLDTGELDDAQAELTTFGDRRDNVIEKIMELFEDLLAVDNETLADAHEMKRIYYDEIQSDPDYQRVTQIANVHTAEKFGVEFGGESGYEVSGIQTDAYEFMADVLDDHLWTEGTDDETAVVDRAWFTESQTMADDRDFFHWKLEFPDAFYSVDGEKRANPGFDAVFGNPPYVKIQNLKDSNPEFVEFAPSEYETASGRFDIYSLFVERGVGLSRDSRLSYILPNKFFESGGGKELRKFLKSNQLLDLVLDFWKFQIFEGATTYTCILGLRSEQDSFQYSRVRSKPTEIEDLHAAEYSTIETESLDDDNWALTGPRERRVLDKMEDAGEPVGDLAAYLSEGIVSGDNDVLFPELIEQDGEFTRVRCPENGEEYELESEVVRPLVTGDEIERYLRPDVEYCVVYPYEIQGGEHTMISEERLESEFPRTYDYLTEFRERLADRGTANMRYNSWYALYRSREKQLFESKKVITPDIGQRCEFSLDEEGEFYLPNSAYGIVPKTNTEAVRHYLLAVLNSTVTWFYIYQTSPVLRGDFRRFMTSYLSPLPVPESMPEHDVDQRPNDDYEQKLETYRSTGNLPSISSVGDFLSYLGDEILELRGRRAGFNLDLGTYLPNQQTGPELQNVGVFQPAPDIDDRVTGKTDEYPNLRVEEVQTTREQFKLEVDLKLRYKPEGEDEYEYTDAFVPAFEVLDVSDEQAELIADVLTYAVESTEYDSFRRNAALTISPLDRFKELVLPDFDEVQSDFERYRRAKRRAGELDEQIDATEELIDRIVYDLYDLTHEEREIIETSLSD